MAILRPVLFLIILILSSLQFLCATSSPPTRTFFLNKFLTSFVEYEIHDLYGSDLTTFSAMAANWQLLHSDPNYINSQPPIYQCGDLFLLGGPGKWFSDSVFIRNYTNLPPHNELRYIIKLVSIDPF